MHTVLVVGGFAPVVGIIKVSNSFPEVRKKLVQDNIVAITKYIFQVACLNLLYATNSAIKPTGNSQSDQQYVVVFFFSDKHIFCGLIRDSQIKRLFLSWLDSSIGRTLQP